jgi:hypothetical protein
LFSRLIPLVAALRGVRNSWLRGFGKCEGGCRSLPFRFPSFLSHLM